MDDTCTSDPAAEARTFRRALAGLLAGAIAIAFAPIFFKLVGGDGRLGPSAVGFWRLALAMPLLLSWMALHRRRAAPAPQRAPRRYWLVLPGLFFAGDLAVWHWAMTLTSAANATLLANCAPIFVALAGWLWLKERFGVTFLAGLATALIGVAVVMRASQGQGPGRLAGDALGLATAVFYAGYQLSVKRLRDHYRPATIMTASALVAAPLLGAIALLSRENLLATTAAAWAVLVALAVVSHVFGQGIIAWALAHLPVSFASVSLLIQPVAVAALGWAILAEPVVPLQAVGGITVLAGVFLARKGIRPAPRTSGKGKV